MEAKINITNWRSLLPAAFMTILALVFIRFPLPFLYGIELLFFTAVSWFVYLRHSLHSAVLLTIICAACGIFLWDQSPLLALYPIEILLVGWFSAKTKRSIILWDAIYWFTFGLAGYYYTYNWLTDSSDFNTTVFLLFLIANGLINIFFSELAAEYLPSWRFRPNQTRAKWRIGRISYHLCLSLLILPIFIYLLISGYIIYRSTQFEISAKLDTIYNHVNEEINRLSETELRNFKVRSILQKASVQKMFYNVTTGTDIQLILIDSNQNVVSTLDPTLAKSDAIYDWKALGTVEQFSNSLYLWQPDDISTYNKVTRWAESDFVSIYTIERLGYTLIAKQPVTTFQHNMFNLYLLSLLLVGLSTMLTAVIAYSITKRFSKSLNELGEFSTGLPRRIRLQDQIEWKNSPLYEIDILNNNFRDMSKELASMFYEINQSEEKLRILAHYDTLTGLANRNSFSLYLPSLIEEARDRQARIACLYIDLDYFKLINDTYGHEAGDTVIKEVGARLMHYNTDSTKAFRLSGDEFIIVKSEPLPSNLVLWAQAIHDAIVTKGVPYNGKEIQIQLSAGIAIYPDHGQESESLLRSSDHAMYQAKVTGRNQVRMNGSSDAEYLEGEQ